MKYPLFWLLRHPWGIPLPPGSGGIIDLEENREVIYGAQWLRGKILSRKELDPSLRSGFRRRGSYGRQTPQVTCRSPIASYAAFALASFYSPDREPQGRGSHWGVIALRGSEK